MRAARLDALTGGELDVLPDFGAHGEELGLAEVIAHAFEQFVGPRINGGFVVRRGDGQRMSPERAQAAKAKPSRVRARLGNDFDFSYV